MCVYICVCVRKSHRFYNREEVCVCILLKIRDRYTITNDNKNQYALLLVYYLILSICNKKRVS